MSNFSLLFKLCLIEKAEEIKNRKIPNTETSDNDEGQKKG